VRDALGDDDLLDQSLESAKCRCCAYWIIAMTSTGPTAAARSV